MSGADAAESVTSLLHGMADGAPGAADALMLRVYDELRRMADRRLAGLPPNSTLQPTALVHECYLRLIGKNAQDWQDRKHFFGIAARAMRDIIADDARRAMAEKRGGRHRRVSLDDVAIDTASQAGDLLALHEAVERLALDHPDAADMVTLRFYGGLTLEGVADALGLPLSRVRSGLEFSRAYIHRAMAERAPNR